jgi:hypothetical protein
VKAQINDVKIDLHSEHQFKRAPFNDLFNLRHPTIEALLGMKIITLSLRETWRDVYDLYFLRKPFSAKAFYESFCMIVPSKYCGGKTNRDLLFINLMAKLVDERKLNSMFEDDNMEHLEPKEEVSPPKVIDRFKNFKLELCNETGSKRFCSKTH